MEIELNRIKIRDLYEGYVHNEEDNSIVGYDGKLNIRPKYQREYIYKDKQRDEVIKSVQKGFPLNVMYWCKNDDGNFEMLDGQQRSISICDYIDGIFSIDYRYFHNLTETEKEQILDYELMVYICTGNDKEKLDWFKIINIAGEKLYNQEIRNAIYTGEWLEDAKPFFSKNQCIAYKLGGNYLNGSAIRQDYLETTLRWISENDIENYMAEHQHDVNANEIKLYFRKVIDWVQMIYPNYRKEMKGIEWGFYYNKYSEVPFDTKKLEQEIKKLCEDDDVTSIKGIYEYLLDGEEKHLSLRQFDDKQKRKAYEKQNGICAKCGKHFEIDEMEGDHIIPWSKGGHTTDDNLQMLCKKCNGTKSNN